MNIRAVGGTRAFGVPASVGSNGAGAQPGRWDEIGSVGLSSFAGVIEQAYARELYWPDVFPLYNRLRRSDPEISIVRQLFTAMVGNARLQWVGPENPSDDDKRALEFAESALADLEGGVENFRDDLVSYTPFMGWAWWEAVPGLRRSNWRPPGDDPWRSQFDDGLIGFRRLAWRDHSSFVGWDLDDRSGRLRGMKQLDVPNPQRTLPLDRSIHVTFGDATNPEGLTPLEAVWRLERIKYGLEVVQGMGYEHAAGHLKVQKTMPGELTGEDTSKIRAAARAIMTAQEGNYVALPHGFDADIIDVPFSAAPAILEAIRYYSLLKLSLFNAAWVGMATIAGTGAYSALKDASSTWLVSFNAMNEGFVRQVDAQLGKRLFDYNAQAFPGLTERPKLTITQVEKFIDLDELATFWSAIKDSMPVGDEDFLAVRRKSGFLPETLPEVPIEPEEEQPDEEGDLDDSESDAEDEMDAVPGELSVQSFAVAGKKPTSVIVALFLDPATAKAMAVDGGEKPRQLHMTLAYLGKADAMAPERRRRLKEVVRSFAALHAPLVGRISGPGRFEGSDGTAPAVALVDVPALPEWRERLIDTLRRDGFTPEETHGYIPHITLKYVSGDETVPVEPRDLTFSGVTVAIADKRSSFPLRASPLRELSLANLQRDYTEVYAQHRDAVYHAALEYLVSTGDSRRFKNELKRSITDAFPDVFYAAYGAGGGEDVEPADDQWLTARMNAELGHVDLLFQQLKMVKDEQPPPAELVAEAERRADGYSGTLRALFAEGLLRGQKNKMLTMFGIDGKHTCRDCQRLNGKRYSARKWLSIGIPGVPANSYECGGWQCRHGLKDDDGVIWTQ